MTAQELWALSGLEGSYEAWAFGDAPDELAALVLAGKKTATASALPVYEAEGEPLPRAGEYSVILDSREEAVCVVRTTRVTVTPFAAVTEEHAAREGEGDRSLTHWQRVHRAFFERELASVGRVFDESMPVVCEEFERVFAPAGETLLLCHAGYVEIPKPDVHYGRKNADFGQGFYLTDELNFAGRWVPDRKGCEIWLNTYQLDLSGLRVHRFEQDRAWFDYIFRNRAGRADTLPEADVILGPIANDTIFNTYGVLTSGLLEPAAALELLRLGPCYRQIALKTEKAAAQLRFLGARILEPEELAHYRALAKEEEAAYQLAFAKRMEEIESPTHGGSSEGESP